MNKAEARKALSEGKTLNHKIFTPSETVQGVGTKYVFEDGCQCTPHEFWEARTAPIWNDNWSIV